MFLTAWLSSRRVSVLRRGRPRLTLTSLAQGHLACQRVALNPVLSDSEVPLALYSREGHG